MEIKNYLEKIKSLDIIKSTSGGGAGSILKIEFENFYNLFIYCTWRVEKNDEVLATSNDNSEAIIGRIPQKVKMFENKKVLSFELSNQFDLELKIEENYCLKIFCDVSYWGTEDGGTYDSNWELGVPDEDLYFKINNHFGIETGKYY